MVRWQKDISSFLSPPTSFSFLIRVKEDEIGGKREKRNDGEEEKEDEEEKEKEEEKKVEEEGEEEEKEEEKEKEEDEDEEEKEKVKIKMFISSTEQHSTQNGCFAQFPLLCRRKSCCNALTF